MHALAKSETSGARKVSRSASNRLVKRVSSSDRSKPRSVNENASTRQRKPAEPINLSALGVVEQVKASLETNRASAIIGFVVGGSIPLMSYALAHFDLPNTLRDNGLTPAFTPACAIATVFLPFAYFMTAGFICSSLSLYCWGKKLFDLRIKAFAFPILAEGVMLTAREWWISLPVLAMIVAINAIQVGAFAALYKRSTEAQKANAGF